MGKPKFVVKEGDDGQWYWRMVGANGEIQFVSEGYTREDDAVQGVADAVDSVFIVVTGADLTQTARVELVESIEVA